VGAICSALMNGAAVNQYVAVNPAKFRYYAIVEKQVFITNTLDDRHE
jgi:hypothetical protein